MKKNIFIILLLLLILTSALPANAYIDPGTGSMLFSVIVCSVGSIFFVIYSLWEKFKLIIFKQKTTSKKVPIIIYTESKRYYHVFNDILNEFEKRKYPVLVYVSDEDDEFLKREYEYVKVENIGKGYRAYSKLAFLNADICLMTTPGLDVYQLRRSKNVKHYSHIYHALSDGCTYRLFGTDYYNSILTNTEKMHQYIRILEAKRHLPNKELVNIGSPYMDSMVKNAPKSCTSDRITVLLAPTWGDSAILANFGDKLISELSKTNFNIIVRPHPQSLISEKKLIDKLREKFINCNNIHWDFSSDNLKTMASSDILITDVSGIMYEYSFMFNKPFIYSNATFNKDLYDIRDVKIETFKTNILKTIGKELKEENICNISDIINELISNTTTKDIEKIKDEIWQNQGLGAQNTVDFLINKQKELNS